jgi:hypothetical protein
MTLNELTSDTTTGHGSWSALNEFNSNEAVITVTNEPYVSELTQSVVVSYEHSSDMTSNTGIISDNTVSAAQTDTSSVSAQTSPILPLSHSSNSEQTNNLPTTVPLDLTISLEVETSLITDYQSTTKQTDYFGDLSEGLTSVAHADEETSPVTEENIGSLASETSGASLNEQSYEASTFSIAQTNSDLLPLISITDNLPVTSTNLFETSDEDYSSAYPLWTSDGNQPPTAADRLSDERQFNNARLSAMNSAGNNQREGVVAAIVICSIVGGLALITIFMAILYRRRYK